MIQKITVPAFAYSDAEWNRLLTSTPVTSVVVLDIGMGDINPFDPSAKPWGANSASDRVRRGHDAGLKVLGYIPTKDGAGVVDPGGNPWRTEDAIRKYVDRWYDLAQPDGIFFDEGPYPNLVPVTDAVKSFYKNIFSYVKGKVGGRGNTVMLNAAGFEDSWVMDAADIVILWEETAAAYKDRFDSYAFRAPWIKNNPPERVAHVIHSCPQGNLHDMIALSKQRKAGHVYVFDGTSSSYQRLPSYWEDEMAAVTGEQSATLYRDGRLVLFARGADNAVWHRWQISPNGNWSGWESLGGVATSGPASSLNAPGGLVVFVRGTDNAIWHRWQDVANGAWSGWESLGGPWTSSPAATLYGDGRLVVFARGTDNAIWHRWQLTRNGEWSGWESIGGVATSAPAACLNAPGGLVAFIRGTDGAIWHCWQDRMNGNWSGWESLGGQWKGAPAATLYGDGRLVVFARGMDNAVWHRWQVTRNGDWSAWERIGGVGISSPASSLNAPGGLVAFVRGDDNSIWHVWQGGINGDWSGWESLGAP
jgi:hypothetical protein